MLMMRAARSLCSMSLYALARQTKISPCRLSMIEREHVTATPEERDQVAQALQLDATLLFQTATAESLAGQGA